MFKKILVVTLIFAAVGLLVFGAINRTTNVSASPDTIHDNGGGRGGNGDGTHTGTGTGTGMGDLNAAETESLLYVREEEKLAKDVYSALYAKWSLAVFQNISRSEQTHMDAIMTLLDRYGLADPASSQAGMFNDPTLQRLYTELDAGGNLSLGDALKAGAAIEEIDILDLQSRLAQVDNPDIIQVFNNLLNGSFNHLRAFVSALK